MSVILEPAGACHLLSFCYLAKMIFSEYSCGPDMNGRWASDGLRPGSLRPLGLDLCRDISLFCCCWWWGTIAGVVRWCKIFFTFQFSDRCGVHLACRESSIPAVFLLIIALCLALMQTQTTLFISTVSLWHYNAILLWVGAWGWVGGCVDRSPHKSLILLLNVFCGCLAYFIMNCRRIKDLPEDANIFPSMKIYILHPQ